MPEMSKGTAFAEGSGQAAKASAVGAARVNRNIASGVSVQAIGCAGVAPASVAVSGALVNIGGSGAVSESVITARAGESISALRGIAIVDGFAYLLGSEDASMTNSLVGVSTTAASAGGSLQVRISDVLADSSFAWQSGLPVFLGSEGRLTQEAPQSGFVQIVGVPAGSDKLKIDIQQAIKL